MRLAEWKVQTFPVWWRIMLWKLLFNILYIIVWNNFMLEESLNIDISSYSWSKILLCTPMYSHVLPLYSHVLPLYSHVLPLYSHVLPLYSHCTPIVLPRTPKKFGSTGESRFFPLVGISGAISLYRRHVCCNLFS
jgi:hypothetical protein